MMPYHKHCPCGCDHPQPFTEGGVDYCGACWFKHNAYCVMEECTPKICGDDAVAEREGSHG